MDWMDPKINIILYLSDAFIQSDLQMRLTVHSGYTFFIVSMCVRWELNSCPFALLTQCFTTEPQEQPCLPICFGRQGYD